MRFCIRQGYDIPLGDKPDVGPVTTRETNRVALVGKDYPGLRPSLQVDEGELVRSGETVFRDRRSPAIRVVAPASGVVREINWGPRKQLVSVVIERNDDPPIEGQRYELDELPVLTAAQIRDRLLESGHWVAFRARPFERTPAPEIEPRAIFVTAIDTNPVAPDPMIAIGERSGDFSNGITVLSRLTRGPVYVCTAFARQAPIPELQSVSQVEFDGPHPAGLPGTHIHALETIGEVPDLWHIGYQDVIAIGQLFITGTASPDRVIAFGGPGAISTQILRVPAGAQLSSLAESPTTDIEMIAGSVLAGHRQPGFLGRYHNQVTNLPHEQIPAGRIRKFAGMLGNRSRHRGPISFTTSHRSKSGMLPIENFDRVWPYRTPPSALLRALLLEDTDSATDLGCRGLAEDDLALCSYFCVAGKDYGAALRRTLNAIERSG